MAGDGIAHERAQFGVGHARPPVTVASAGSSRVTSSMIPTIAASTGAAFRRRASPAARPSITTSTFSPTPAPTESIVSNGTPRGVPSSASGCTSSNFAPSSLRCFWVETSVPMTRPICMAEVSGFGGSGFPWFWIQVRRFRVRSSGFWPLTSNLTRFVHVPMVHNSHHAGVNRGRGWEERERCFLPADKEDVFADSGARGVNSHEHAPDRGPIRHHGLQDEEFVSGELHILDGCNDGADDARDVHVSS